MKKLGFIIFYTQGIFFTPFMRNDSLKGDFFCKKVSQAQATLEYFILLTTFALLTILSIGPFFPRVRQAAEELYKAATKAMNVNSEERDIDIGQLGELF